MQRCRTYRKHADVFSSSTLLQPMQSPFAEHSFLLTNATDVRFGRWVQLLPAGNVIDKFWDIYARIRLVANANTTSLESRLSLSPVTTKVAEQLQRIGNRFRGRVRVDRLPMTYRSKDTALPRIGNGVVRRWCCAATCPAAALCLPESFRQSSVPFGRQFVGVLLAPRPAGGQAVGQGTFAIWNRDLAWPSVFFSTSFFCCSSKVE